MASLVDARRDTDGEAPVNIDYNARLAVGEFGLHCHEQNAESFIPLLASSKVFGLPGKWTDHCKSFDELGARAPLLATTL